MHASQLFAASNDFAPGLLARTVLIVEDDELVRDTVARALEDDGYLVVEAETADAGYEILRQRPIGVLFTDIRLPGLMDGWSLAEAARRLFPDLPVIYATGFSTEAPRLVAKSVFLRKPYLPSAVAAAIEQLTREPDDERYHDT